VTLGANPTGWGETDRIEEAEDAGTPGRDGEMTVAAGNAALELELRQLPGVVGVGLDYDDGALTVHLLVSPQERVTDLRRRASEVGRSHAEGPVIIEIEGADPLSETLVASGVTEVGEAGGVPAPSVAQGERVRMLAVRVVEEENEVEVHLARGSARTVGRGRCGLPEGAVLATMEALEGLGARLPFTTRATGSLLVAFDHVVVVTLGPTSGGDDRMGVARAATVEEAATKATLHALNRFLNHDGVFHQADH
jgi:hypothetical protein